MRASRRRLAEERKEHHDPQGARRLPVTGTIDHYVAWLNREVYGGKMTREQKEAAGVSATLYRWFQKSAERRAARGLDL